MRLGLAAYLIHGTNKPSGVGMRVSHGCIRLYPENIEELFSMVPVGTPVNIINQPYKLARHQGKIYLEAHPYLEEDAPLFRDNLTSVVRILIDMTEEGGYDVDWPLANRVIREMKGIPVVIGSFAGSTAPVVDISRADTTGLLLRLDTELSSENQ